jgi:hypothetical protein
MVVCSFFLYSHSCTTFVDGFGIGQTVLNESPALDEKVRQIAFLLNLKGHRSGELPPPSELDRAAREGRQPRAATMIHTCADLEGHIGIDGRFYLVDCHRLFPPLALGK